MGVWLLQNVFSFARVMLVPAVPLWAQQWVMVSPCQAQKEREETPVPQEKGRMAGMWGTFVFIYSFSFRHSVLWELLTIVSHVFFPGKTRFARCAGACRSQGKQGTIVHLLCYRIYKYMQRIVPVHVRHTQSNPCGRVPPVGRNWSCVGRPSRL